VGLVRAAGQCSKRPPAGPFNIRLGAVRKEEPNKGVTMGKKTLLLIGLGVGYILGARAGRQRYEEILRWWDRFTGSPAVQRAAERTKDVATESAKMGMTVVQQGVEKAESAVKNRLGKDDDTLVDLVEEPRVDYSR
jgi:hypothetical protein